jgi:hypothetical protein
VAVIGVSGVQPGRFSGSIQTSKIAGRRFASISPKALLLDGGGLGGGVAAEVTLTAQVGAGAFPDLSLLALLTPPSYPSSIEEEAALDTAVLSWTPPPQRPWRGVRPGDIPEARIGRGLP